MSKIDEALARLERAIDHLEEAADKAQSRPKLETTVLAQTATQVAARLDAAIGRLDRILED
jgi:chromosome segregation ATPase